MIPQSNPHANYLRYQAEIDEALCRVLKSGRYILSEETSRFEAEFAAYIGTKYAVGMSSGTQALHLSLRALGVGPGDEVITVSHTAVATVAAIEMAGATPVFIDIHPLSYTLNPERLYEVLTARTKAVIPVHLYGQPADLDPILALAKKHHLFVLEDCAQSHGAKYRERRTGSWGHAAAFSFYPTKNLGGLGDGGAVTTQDPFLYERLKALRQYGWDENRISLSSGWNSRLDELQAAVLRVKLAHLEESNKRRIEIACAYHSLLGGSPKLTLPSSIDDTVHVFHQYVVQCADNSGRDRLMTFLSEQGIQTAVHYPVPVHMQPAYMHRLPGSQSLPVTEGVCPRILSLPAYPELADYEIEKVAMAIATFLLRGQ